MKTVILISSGRIADHMASECLMAIGAIVVVVVLSEYGIWLSIFRG
jgi:hypothetical protein